MRRAPHPGREIVLIRDGRLSRTYRVGTDWLRIGQLSKQKKDLETLLLRQQLALLERKLNQPCVSRASNA